jgi:hypothetical protein
MNFVSKQLGLQNQFHLRSKPECNREIRATTRVINGLRLTKDELISYTLKRLHVKVIRLNDEKNKNFTVIPFRFANYAIFQIFFKFYSIFGESVTLSATNLPKRKILSK